MFAGFAVFLWYRLVQDAWEREDEEAELAAAAADGPSAGRPSDDPTRRGRRPAHANAT